MRFITLACWQGGQCERPGKKGAKIALESRYRTLHGWIDACEMLRCGCGSIVTVLLA